MGQLTNRAAKKEETDRTIQSSALSVSQVPYKLSSSIEGEASSALLFLWCQEGQLSSNIPSHEKSYIKGLLSRFARFHSLTGGNEDVWFIMPGPWPYRFSGDPAPSKEGTGSLQDKGIRKKTRSTTVLKNPRSSPCQSSARASFLIINNLDLYIHSWVEPFSALRLILIKIDSLFTKSNET